MVKLAQLAAINPPTQITRATAAQATAVLMLLLAATAITAPAM